MKFYRWLDFYKWDLIIVASGLLFFSWMISCKPEYNDVQFKEAKQDTINANKGHN
tara:strand:+ start:260 stop:424 length:165 start_codon:yes stop_codon:yes gene_type:complete